MLLSMTGYGRATKSFRNKTIMVEIRSLNSKYSDLRIKIPQHYREHETVLRRIVTESTQRGKVDMNIELKSLQGDEEFGLNKPLFRRYYEELSQMGKELGMDHGDLYQAILRIPNVVSSGLESIDDEEWKALLDTLNEALDNFKKFRETEGEATAKDLHLRITTIMDLLKQVSPYEIERVDKLRQRLHQNLADYLGKENIDENRFEQEILFYLEKMDINEEKVRLEQHCRFFLEEMEKKAKSKGRKLSFIGQEIGREINTLGAKAYSSDIQRLVVGMKDELEKIKEQVANIV
ncbi:YicC/YloC family endoribonuclease [Flavilitoribacter nigricans]|nr:YicC/YloC family endoribonuclease [Flavilitoribacter nigricans]